MMWNSRNSVNRFLTMLAVSAVLSCAVTRVSAEDISEQVAYEIGMEAYIYTRWSPWM